MDLAIVGPGRAGMSLALAALDAGHGVSAVIGRNPSSVADAAGALHADPKAIGEPLPPCDLVVVAVRDDAIADVAALIGPLPDSVGAAVHLSGLTPVSALADLGSDAVGSFHPLQTLPDPEAGRRRLPGAWVAITAGDESLVHRLADFARSIDLVPFELADADKALYHAAAAAAANYPLAALAMARRLFGEAGVPFDAAEPLVRAVVDNAFDMGPSEALTGPVARGDTGTVAAQIRAVGEAAPDLVEHFVAMARATAHVAGTSDRLGEVLG